MESDKIACVRETGATNDIVIVDMASSEPCMKCFFNCKAGAARMNPTSNIMAVAVPSVADFNLQIFALETMEITNHCLHIQPVVFWKWITPSKLGLVTATSVFHWDISVCLCGVPWRFNHDACKSLCLVQGCSEPERVFERTTHLETSQINNYAVDFQENWCVLIGRAPGTAQRYVFLCTSNSKYLLYTYSKYMY